MWVAREKAELLLDFVLNESSILKLAERVLKGPSTESLALVGQNLCVPLVPSGFY
jgi:hypothetical protein